MFPEAPPCLPLLCWHITVTSHWPELYNLPSFKPVETRRLVLPLVRLTKIFWVWGRAWLSLKLKVVFYLNKIRTSWARRKGHQGKHDSSIDNQQCLPCLVPTYGPGCPPASLCPTLSLPWWWSMNLPTSQPANTPRCRWLLILPWWKVSPSCGITKTEDIIP